MLRAIANQSRSLLPYAAAVAGAAALSSPAWAPPYTTAAADAKPHALDPNGWREFKLAKREQLTHNTHLFRFEVPQGHTAELPVASCLLTKYSKHEPGEEKPKVVIRPYTPINNHVEPHYLDLAIKVYPEGNMSKHIGNLQPGDKLSMKGPLAKYPYKPNAKKAIGMIAGGSGITPMLQVAEEILRNPDDKTQLSLIFANVSEDDIILKDRIDGLAAKHKNFHVHYVVDKPSSANWKGGVGYVTQDMVKMHLPAPGEGHLIMVCGPPPMMNAVSGDKLPDKSQGPLSGVLKAMGYTEDMVYKF